MDINAINQFMSEAGKKAFSRNNPQNRENLEMIQAASMADRIDLSIGHTGAEGYETLEGITKTITEENGALQVFQLMLDSDGDWTEICTRVYAKGYWLWIEATLTPVENPHYVEPAAPAEGDA